MAGTGPPLRPARDDDADGLVALIGGVYAEYPGCVMDLDGVDADLQAIATHLAARDGRMWVVEDDRGLVACVGYAPTTEAGEPAVELKRLYVRRDARGRGLGSSLVAHVERVARDLGVDTMVAWSDSRFTDAHRLYERLGYVRQPETRRLHDPSDTTELKFVRRPQPASQPPA